MNQKLDISNNETTYKTIGNYNLIHEKIEPNNLFFSIIKTTLNKAKKLKKIALYKNFTPKRNYEKIRPYKKFKNFKKTKKV